jgi:hypothetical protein
MRTPFILTIGPAKPLTAVKSRRREQTIRKTRVYREYRAREQRLFERSLGQRKFPSNALMFYPPPSTWPNPAIDLVCDALRSLNKGRGKTNDEQMLELDIWTRQNKKLLRNARSDAPLRFNEFRMVLY